ncbi:MAG: sensor histidine kinase, partial [Afipia sp.]|nr:sensor histidine kinase [Afipia sp.]
MRVNSLATRLFVSATAWVVLILLLTGIVLSAVYQRSAERSFDRRLNFYLRTLIAEADAPDDPNDKDKDKDRSVQSLGEPLFELPLSGWYWRMERVDGVKPEVRASRSLWDASLPKLEERGIELNQSGVRIAYVDGPEDQHLRLVERPVDLG